jgi:phosphate transport system substrate-binding protein
MNDGGVVADAGEVEAAFAREAKSAGIVLPTRRRFDPWETVVVVVAIVVVAAGIGTAAGWWTFHGPPSPSGGGFESPTCTVSHVVASGSVASSLDPSFAGWLSSSGDQLAQGTGGCFAAQLSTAAGDGYAALTGSPRAEFVATDTAPNPTEVAQFPYPVAVVPVALDAVAFVYNLPGTPFGLNLTPSILAGIYLGTIDSWNAPSIASVNPGIDLGDAPSMTVFHEPGTAGTSQLVAQFLTDSNATWARSVGASAAVDWPVGTSAADDATMLADVAGTAGSVGFVSMVGGTPTGVGVASVEDAAGNFTTPTPATVWVAAQSLASSTALASGNWSGFSLLGATADGSYPVSALAYFAMYRDLGTPFGGALNLTGATWLLTLAYWLTGLATAAPLPPAYVAATLGVLDNETYDGTPIVHLDSEGGESGGETGEF